MNPADRELVSILVPTLGRPLKLARLLRLIEANSEWPHEVIVKYDEFGNGRRGCPTVLAECVAESKGGFVCYLGNDLVPRPGFLRIAMEAMQKWFPDMDGLVGLADQYWLAGEIATHWVASKKLLPMLGGQFFFEKYTHTCCDSELTERCRQANKYVWCEQAKVYHDHPIQNGFQSGVDEVYKLAYDPVLREQDAQLLLSRAKQFGFPIRANFLPPIIPRKVWTCWLGSQPMPPLVERCIASQRKFSLGWEFNLITDENRPKGIPYVETALAAGKVVKAVDYLKYWLLHEHGGVYCDADVSLLKPIPDTFLTAHMFLGRERNNWLGNGVIGAEPGHAVLKACLERVDREFTGDDDRNFAAANQVLTETVYQMGVEAQGVKIYEPDVFTPYDHQNKKEEITENTVAYHHFMVSWSYPNVHPCIDLRPRLGDLSERKVLNIGIGPGDSGLAMQLKTYPIKRLDHVEIHQPYIDTAKQYPFWVAKEVNYYLGDAREFPVEDYDLVLAFDVLEHMPKDDALKLIARCPHMVIFGPLENSLHNDREGVDMTVESQAHLSLWTEQDFIDLGFKTEVIPDFHREHGESWDALFACRG
jgi:hypothetical protein